ncbi:MAG: hypothetical protein ACYTBJ_06935 [Planctomycetota bacterium]
MQSRRAQDVYGYVLARLVAREAVFLLQLSETNEVFGRVPVLLFGAAKEPYGGWPM